MSAPCRDAIGRAFGHLLRLALAAVVTAAFAPSLVALAQQQAVQISDVRIGFDGQYKIGHWTPVWVDVRGGSQSADVQVEVIVPDGDGVPSRVATPADRPLHVESGASESAPFYVKVGQLRGEIRVAVREADRVLSSTTLTTESTGAQSATADLILAIGSPPSNGSQVDRSAAQIAYGPSTAVIDDLRRLPTDWYGYDGVDVVVLQTHRPEFYRSNSQSDKRLLDERLEALDQWIVRGGRLLLYVAGQNAALVEPQGPLARFIAGHVDGAVALREATALENYVDTSDRLDNPGVNAGRPLRLDVLRLTKVHGAIEAHAGAGRRDLPLVVRAPHGFGEIVLATFDLDQPALLTWLARPQLLQQLLARPRAPENRSETSTLGQVTTLGYTDLAGQLRCGLDQFEGVELVPFWFVAVLIAIYVGLLLVEYLVLCRLGQMHWTWISFPALLVAVSAGAYVLARAWKGDELRTNQADLVDVDVESGLVRGTLWSHVFSPRSAGYDFALAAQRVDGRKVDHAERLISWMGLPGGGFGGMGTPDSALGRIGGATSGVALYNEPYDFAHRLDQMFGVPIAIWSTKGLTGRWTCLAQPAIRANLVNKGLDVLSGTLTSDLDEPLTDCVLLYDRWAYPIGRLGPSAQIVVEQDLEPQTVETYFKHVSIRNDKDVVTPYDRLSVDVWRILEMMMFHEITGGQAYTGLTDRYQEFVDLSHLLRTGRAILVGRASRPVRCCAVEMRRLPAPAADAGTTADTYYRCGKPGRTD